MTQPIQPPQIPQLSPEEANREMTPAEVRQLQDTIRNVRKIIARFHDTRRRNNERMAGLRAASVYPQQVQQVVHSTRQPEVEAQAVEQLRQFLRVLRGHEPTRQEMQEGIPDGLEQQMGMGLIPFAVGAVAIALGTSVYSVFSYLDSHEERIAQQTATPLERGMRALSDNIWGVAAVGAVAGGVYIYHRTQSSGERKHQRDLEKIRASREDEFEQNPSDEDEEESFIEKAKSFVRNGLFPAEKNPGSRPSERLNDQYEKLSENEKERFVAMMNGEEYEDDEPEEEPEEELEEEPEEELDDELDDELDNEPEENPSEEEPEVEENPNDSEEEPLEEEEQDEPDED